MGGGDGCLAAVLSTVRQYQGLKGQYGIGLCCSNPSLSGIVLSELVGDGWIQRIPSSQGTCEGVALTSHWRGGQC